jgi:small subunit ribosomal protein S20
VANTKSAIKRIRTSEKRRLRNRTVRSRVRSVLKTARLAVTTPGEDARTAVLQAIRTLDKAVTKGVIHPNTAARKKSALARRLNVHK